MIPLTHPVIHQFLAAARKGPCDSVMVRCYLFDRLTEAGCGFFGDPDGPSLRDACWWYARGEDEDEPALREVLATMDEMLGHTERTAQVRPMRASADEFVRLLCRDGELQEMTQQLAERAAMEATLYGRVVVSRLLGTHPVVKNAEQRALEGTRRDLRRRVLAMYPEVKVTLLLALSYHAVTLFTYPLQDILSASGFRVDLDTDGTCPIRCGKYPKRPLWLYTQTLTAPNLIAPEPNRERDAVVPREAIPRCIGFPDGLHFSFDDGARTPFTAG